MKNRLLFPHKDEQSADTCYVMDKAQKHTKWKKLDTRDCMHIVFIWNDKRGKFMETKGTLVVAWAENGNKNLL